MANFNSVKSQQKVLFLAAEIDFMEQNYVWALDLSLIKDLVTSLVVFMQEAR